MKCLRRPALKEQAVCGRCRALKREADLDMVHDPEHHAEMLEARMLPDSVCSATGLSLHTLKKLGVRLSVDRIDNSRGYVKGNCVLLAEPLNQAKGQGTYIPQASIDRLLYRAAKVRKSRHDNV